METKAFQNLLESIINLNEDHMKGKTVIVNGKRGVVGKEVSKDGETENDEVYRVKFEDGSVKDIPARDMEIAGDTKNKKQPSENEAEDITSESVELDELSNKTLAHYLVKASKSLDDGSAKHKGKRATGMMKALKKRPFANISKKESVELDEVGYMGYRPRISGEFRTGPTKAKQNQLKRRNINPKKLGTGHAIVPDTIQGKPNPKQTKESVELDELKKSTLGSYINKAASGIKKSEYEAGRAGRRYDDAHSRMSSPAPEVRQLARRAKGQAVSDYRAAERTTKKRQSGIQRAVKKLGEGSLNELDKKTLRSYATKARTQITKDLYTDFGKHKPSTNRRAKGLVKAKERLGEGSLGYQKALRSKGKEKEGVRSGNKREKAMDFRRWDAERQKNKKAHGTNEDYQCPSEMKKQNLKGAGVGIPAINNLKWGTKGFTDGGSDTAIGSPVGNPDAAKRAKKAIKEDMNKYDSYDDWRKAGFPTKQKKKKPMVRVKTNREIGWEMRDGATGKVIKKGGPPVSKK